MTDFVQVRIPAALRDRIDAVRGDEKREPWVRDAIELRLADAPNPDAKPTARFVLPDDLTTQPAVSSPGSHGANPELCKSCETLGPPKHKPCWKCGAQA